MDCLNCQSAPRSRLMQGPSGQTFELCDRCSFFYIGVTGWVDKGPITKVQLTKTTSTASMLPTSGGGSHPRCAHGIYLSECCFSCVTIVGAYDRVLVGDNLGAGSKCECGNKHHAEYTQLHSYWCPVFRQEF